MLRASKSHNNGRRQLRSRKKSSRKMIATEAIKYASRNDTARCVNGISCCSRASKDKRIAMGRAKTICRSKWRRSELWGLMRGDATPAKASLTRELQREGVRTGERFH